MHTLTVADIMSTELVTVESATPLLGVAAILSERHLSGAPVLEGNRVVGVVSAADVLRHAASAVPEPARAGQVAWTPSDDLPEWAEDDEPPADFFTRLRLDAPEDLDFAPDHRDTLEQATAGEIMTRELCQLPPDASVLEAANYMLWAEIHRVLVIEQERLVGIVTAMDIVRAVAQRKL